MIKTTILTIAALTGLLILGFNFDEVFSVESNATGPVPIPYPIYTKAIPDWVDNNFRWYVNGEIDEKTLLTSMNWMFDNNIMHLSEKAAQEVQQMREEINDLKQELEQVKAAIATPNLLYEEEGVDEAAPYVPGGSVVSAAVSGVAVVDLPTESGIQKVLVVGGENTDVNALVQLVLRESYMETNEDLQFYADKVRFYNDLKKAIRDEARSANPDFLNPNILNPDFLNPDIVNPEHESMNIEFLELQKELEIAEADVLDLANQLQAHLDAQASLRETISELRDIISDDNWSIRFVYYIENDVVTSVLSSAKDAMTLEQELEQNLQTMSDMTQMMQLDLQDAMNKQAQAMQTLSAIMKSQHDTLKAIINNMR